jgi:sulfur-carrier protein
MQVRLFAALRDIAGASRLDVTAPSVGALVDELGARFGDHFVRILEAGSVVIDGQVVGRDRPLDPGDEVALLPPVSGGSIR